MIVRVTSPAQLERFIPDLTRCFEDFLRRAKEPFVVDHQWAALLHAMLRPDGLLFLVAFDDRVRPVGYLLAQETLDFWGLRSVMVLQTYAKPGHRGFLDVFHERLEQWAHDLGVQYCAALTHRQSAGYVKWVGRYGFMPEAVLYLKPLQTKEHPDGEITAPAAAPAGS